MVREVPVKRPKLIRDAFEEAIGNVVAFRPDVWAEMTPEMRNGYWLIFANGALAAYTALQRSTGPDAFLANLEAIRNELNAIKEDVMGAWADRQTERIMEEATREQNPPPA